MYDPTFVHVLDGINQLCGVVSRRNQVERAILVTSQFLEYDVQDRVIYFADIP